MTPGRAWRRLGPGPIWAPAGTHPWARSHAQMPTVEVRADRLRVHVSTRDAEQRSVGTRVDLDRDDPRRVLGTADEPVLGRGRLGCFDDEGAMPSSVLQHDGRTLLYYVGWNRGHSVPYRNAIGLAVATASGTFERIFEGPVLDRTARAPHFCSCPHVLFDGGRLRMWYLACQGWEVHDGVPEPIYDIRHTSSDDGIDWRRDETLCLDRLPGEGGLARPWVVRDGNRYLMWFCARSASGYRDDPQRGYRILFAESDDGLGWIRRDEFSLPASGRGWDGAMTAFPCVVEVDGRRLLFYNGDGFGRDGFGVAVLDDSVVDDRG